MTNQTIIAFSGYPGTGKSTLAQCAAEEMDFFTFEGSAYLKVFAENEGIVLSSRQEFSDYYRRVRHDFGKDWFVATMLKRPERRLLNTGLRNRVDFERIHAVGGTVIGLVCPDEVCLERIDTTNPKNPQTIEEYRLHKILDSSGSEDGYGAHTSWVLERADVLLDTSLPIEQTVEVFHDIVKRIESS